MNINSLFKIPKQSGVFLGNYQANLYDEKIKSTEKQLFSVKDTKNQSTEAEGNLLTQSKLGLISSNPFILESSNFSHKRFFINITVGLGYTIERLQSNIDVLLGSVIEFIEKFNLDIKNVLFIFCFLEGSLDEISFNKLFKYDNNNYFKELQNKYPLLMPTFFCLTEYVTKVSSSKVFNMAMENETNFQKDNSDNINLSKNKQGFNLNKEKEGYVDCLIIHKHNLSKYTAQQTLFSNLLPCFKEVDNEFFFVLQLDYSTVINEMTLSSLFKSLMIPSLGAIKNIKEDEEQNKFKLLFDNNIIATTGSYNLSKFNSSSSMFFSGIFDFENIEKSIFDQQFSNILNSGLELSHRLYMMKLKFSDLYNIEKYFNLNSKLLNFDSNIYLHDYCFNNFLKSSLNSDNNKPYNIHLVQDASFYSLYHMYKYSDWLQDNSNKSASYFYKGCYETARIFESTPLVSKFAGIYYFLCAILKFLTPSFLTLIFFVVFSIGLENYNPAYGFTAVFPLCYFICLTINLLGEFKYTSTIMFLLNIFLIFYYIFVLAVILIFFSYIFNRYDDILNTNKGAFISLFILNFIFGIIPYILNIGSLLSFRYILNFFKFLIFSPTYSSIATPTSFSYIFSNRGVALKSNFTIIFLIANFLFSLLIYTIHSTGNLKYLLGMTVIITVFHIIKIILIVLNFFIYKFGYSKAVEDKNLSLAIREYIVHSAKQKSNSLETNTENKKITTNKIIKNEPSNQISEKLNQIEDLDVEVNANKTNKIENQHDIEGHYNSNEKNEIINDNEGVVYGDNDEEVSKNKIDNYNNNNDFEENDQENNIVNRLENVSNERYENDEKSVNNNKNAETSYVVNDDIELDGGDVDVEVDQNKPNSEHLEKENGNNQENEGEEYENQVENKNKSEHEKSNAQIDQSVVEVDNSKKNSKEQKTVKHLDNDKYHDKVNNDDQIELEDFEI